MQLLSSCLPKVAVVNEIKYTRLNSLENSPSAKRKNKNIIMMENTIGLEDGKCYKFRNRADNSVIEFMLGSSNKMICGQEVHAGENSHQIFEAVEEDSGQFRIACKYQSAEIQHFWDYLPHRKQLIHKKKSTAESSLQLWASECVPGMDTAFFIISVQNGFCLKSQGRNKQIAVAERSDADHHQHWRLEVQPF